VPLCPCAMVPTTIHPSINGKRGETERARFGFGSTFFAIL